MTTILCQSEVILLKQSPVLANLAPRGKRSSGCTCCYKQIGLTLCQTNRNAIWFHYSMFLSCLTEQQAKIAILSTKSPGLCSDIFLLGSSGGSSYRRSGRPPPIDQNLGLALAARLRHGDKISLKSLTFGHFLCKNVQKAFSFRGASPP